MSLLAAIRAVLRLADHIKTMKSDSIGGFLAVLLAVIFVIVGLWFNALNRMPVKPAQLPSCDYGISVNCEP